MIMEAEKSHNLLSTNGRTKKVQSESEGLRTGPMGSVSQSQTESEGPRSASVQAGEEGHQLNSGFILFRTSVAWTVPTHTGLLIQALICSGNILTDTCRNDVLQSARLPLAESSRHRTNHHRGSQNWAQTFPHSRLSLQLDSAGVVRGWLAGLELGCRRRQSLPRMATEHLKCGWSRLSYVVSVKYTNDFKDLLKKERKKKNILVILH